ncbi:hypothetical protein EDB81DRAFT_849326 [Dactylonectria macrodidyma]|uniref:NACHT domain-containing protein n=1 Tax=Dactylonectria macrodidyma TaxID=307937 RepID=A0A9P9CYU9_9HYPO|nr:hypothetical protein EDB81DRAFT_849326 [Dactylonectria macrodidyma]
MTANITNIDIKNGDGTSSPIAACLESLFFAEMDSRYNDKNIKAAGGTCEWLFRHKNYERWAARHRDLLWIKGKPGSGKSTLLRHALEHVKKAPRIGDRPFILSFFFHGRGDKLQKTPLGLFQSLLHQVLSQVPETLPDLVDTFQQHCQNKGEPGKDWQWDPNELQRFFESWIPRALESRPVWLFVDALDECGEDNAVDLVEAFKSLLGELTPTGSQFLICFTCRHYPILELDYGKDISAYVQDRFSVQTASRIPDTTRQAITDCASGIFMWARLVTERVLSLERKGEGWKKIEAEIVAIPQDLDKLYNELVQGMEKKLASLKLIQWICFATRPLSLEELRWAMIVDHDCSHKSLQQCETAADFPSDSDIVERRLKTLSRGLAEAVPSSNTQVVQFIHQSVKDFFVKNGLSALHRNVKLTEVETAKVDFVVGMAHYQLSRTCIRYLAMDEIARPTTRDRGGLTSEFPLLNYVTTSWLSHVKESETRKVSQDDLLDYFNWPSEALVQLWVRVYGIISPYSDNCPPKGTSMVHIVSRYQLIGPLRVILQRADRGKADVDARDEDGRTPLWLAAKKGHEAVVKLLLDMGKADVNAKDRYDQTPLSQAAEKGHEDSWSDAALASRREGA